MIALLLLLLSSCTPLRADTPGAACSTVSMGSTLVFRCVMPGHEVCYLYRGVGISCLQPQAQP